jgi:hypothetical protein
MPSLVLNQCIVLFFHNLTPVRVTKSFCKCMRFTCRGKLTISCSSISVLFLIMYSFLKPGSNTWRRWWWWSFIILSMCNIVRKSRLPPTVASPEDPMEESSANTVGERGDSDRGDRVGGSAACASGGARPVAEEALGRAGVCWPHASVVGGGVAWNEPGPEPGCVGGTGTSTSGSG